MIPNKPKSDEPRINEEIKTASIRLIAADGGMVGIVPVKQGLELAAQSGLDLVEISPNAEPPVCKVMDYGKYKYELQKKESIARKNRKVITIKEIKIRPGIDPHDYEIKLKSVRKFIQDGDKVKFTMRFRGRELSHQEIGLKLLEQVKTDMGDIIRVEHEPKFEGRQIVMIIAPAGQK